MLKASTIAGAAQNVNTGGAYGKATLTPNGSKIEFASLEEELTLSGVSTASTIQIPAGALVFGVGARVTEAITGSGQRFLVGWSGQHNKFSNMSQYFLGETARGLINGPTIIDYSNQSIVIYSQLDSGTEGGSFTAGKVRLAVHYMILVVPQS